MGKDEYDACKFLQSIKKHIIFIISQLLSLFHGTNNMTQYYIVYPSFIFPNSDNWIIPFSKQSHDNHFEIKEESPFFCKQIINETILLQTSIQSSKNAFFCSHTKINKKINEKQKKITKDEDYQPQLFITKKGKKSQQLQNRNVMPNIIRLILSFIQKKGKSCDIVQKLLERWGGNGAFNLKRFYLYQNMKRNKMNNYVNEDSLKQLIKIYPEQFQLYPIQEQQLYNKITRTIINYFLREQLLICVLTSRRMDKTKRTHHINAIRTILELLSTLV